TPNLDHLAADGELVWFRDVVTTHALTLPALFAALTLQTPDGLRTVIDVFNTAGYETYWLSNQYQFAAHELNSALASIVYTAKQQVWLNSVNFTGDERVIQLDQHLLAPFRKALIDPAPRKLIFLHLIGSHFDYGAHYDRPYFSSFESPMPDARPIGHRQRVRQRGALQRPGDRLGDRRAEKQGHQLGTPIPERSRRGGVRLPILFRARGRAPDAVHGRGARHGVDVTRIPPEPSRLGIEDRGRGWPTGLVRRLV